MSDMASSNRKGILESIYRGKQVVIRQGENIKYPVQTNPLREVWKTWKKAMGTVAKGTIIFLPLGG